MSSLIPIQPGHAGRCPKLQRLCPLLPCYLNGLMKTLLDLDNIRSLLLSCFSTSSCSGERSACALHQQQFTFEPIQLRLVAPLACAISYCQRVLY